MKEDHNPELEYAAEYRCEEETCSDLVVLVKNFIELKKTVCWGILAFLLKSCSSVLSSLLLSTLI